ncbi:c-type cytochrome [Sulfurospirillum sp. 1307]|jgi:cytochrome c553
MIKHIIAAISTVLALWAMVHVYNLDKEVNKTGRIARIIEKSKMEVHLKTKKTQVVEEKKAVKVQKTKKVEDEMAVKLKALKDKAGNIAAFKVSPLYKKNCSSCHGSMGEGIIGPKLIGQSEDKIFQALKDFKSGKKKNYVMYGLLGNLSEEQLASLSKEIASFKDKLDASNNN